MMMVGARRGVGARSARNMADSPARTTMITVPRVAVLLRGADKAAMAMVAGVETLKAMPRLPGAAGATVEVYEAGGSIVDPQLFSHDRANGPAGYCF
jgi:hypothetical protein